MADIDIVSKVISPLSNVNKDLKEVVLKLEEVIQTSYQIGGNIGPQLASNVQKTIETIKNVMSGADNSSIRSMINYMLEVPIKSTISAKVMSDIDDGELAQGNEPVTPDVVAATEPDLSAGPQSAIVANESVEAHPMDVLASYFKEQYKTNVREAVAQDAGMLSIDRLKESGMIKNEGDDWMFRDEGPTVPDYANPNLFTEAEEDEDVITDEEQLNEDIDVSDWRSLTHSMDGTMEFDLGNN